jgi:hypothetical protein
MSKVQALFVDPKGVYPELLGVEACWDEARDAREFKYTGNTDPVVCHPPCQLWVNFAAVNWKRYGRQRPAWYHGGSDGDCFLHALAYVRAFGGVLEHPAFTHAWDAFGLLRPDDMGWSRDYCKPEGWVCEVWQSAYGHGAQKRTWLYYVGKRPPFELDWRREPGTHQVGWFDRNKPTLSKRQACATPRAFAETLIALAEWSRG